ncbi:hypothetical protein [Planktosalinus lacus]|uniref:Stealth protein CR2 conserved region 2 domain-containing protein n=1 Tax=Planktosalinus lacus TaxID=1526573 RepID=A0A8J2V9V6_9FLAO|nr:hypothetical protein [Planktosalinus lacus]GGD91356.1 hypothetical protein GCM10011312_13930 [Planktosalinus lacus]
MTKEHPIDAVVLWVDGGDSKHKSKMLPHIENIEKINTKSFRTRYDHVNEIKFTIDSLIKFAPYIRNIFIITDEQTPEFLNTEKNNKSYKKISIIDHKLIFKGYEQYLPTFNSLTIETFMFRVPGLAEHFIYLNDDIFLINKTSSNDFFRDGLPVLRGKWLNINKKKRKKKIKQSKFSLKHVHQNSSILAGFSEKFFYFRHTPHPLRKSTLENFFKQNEQTVLDNIQYKFRNKKQFIIQGLANHLEIKNKSFIQMNRLQLIYFRSYKKPLLWYKIKLNFNNNKKLFLGLQSLDLCPQPVLIYLLKWLEKRVN